MGGTAVSGRDMALAALAAVIWGLGFPASQFALQSFSPAQLTALRFVIAALPVFVVPRPALPWRTIVLIGATLFTGQFLLIFFALVNGLPPGLASVTQQMHAFFTVLLAAVFLGDRPTGRQVAGMTIAFAGLGVIASTVGAELPRAGLALGVSAAFSWAVGNVLVKRAPAVPTLSLVVWCSLVPPLPAMLVSLSTDRDPDLISAVILASWPSVGGVVYLGVLATVVAYAVWGRLLQRYPSGAVMPFALLAPCSGIVAAAALFGETGSPTRYAGMALILAGVAVVVIPMRPPALTPSGRRAASAARRASSDRP